MSSCDLNQCSATASNNTRCTNKCISGSSHCELHKPKATSLYIKYKQLSELVDKINLDVQFDDIYDHIDYVMECYILLNKTFNARLKHRKYAIAPELYDDGHDHQFAKLGKQIDACEFILNELYDSIESDEYDSSSSSEEETYAIVRYNQNDQNNKNGKYKNIADKVKQCRRYRAEQERDINMWVDRYTQENKVILDRRRKIVEHIVMYIDKLFEDVDPDGIMCILVKSVVIFNLSLELHKIGYFTNRFVPSRCKEKHCSCFVPYDVKLGCGCIFENNSLNKYFGLLTEESLKSFFEAILINKSRLLPLTEDIFNLYQKYDQDIMFLKSHLVWDQLLKRLTLCENFQKKEEPLSKILASTRLKNKFYQRKLNKDLLSK